jgi:hypothetical protein
MDSALGGGEWSASRAGHFAPEERPNILEYLLFSVLHTHTHTHTHTTDEGNCMASSITFSFIQSQMKPLSEHESKRDLSITFLLNSRVRHFSCPLVLQIFLNSSANLHKSVYKLLHNLCLRWLRIMIVC